MLFLHGSAERGRDGRKQTKVGLGPVLQEYPDPWPALVVMPQCPPGERWTGPAADAALLALALAQHDYPVDESRIYLTGVSMGGYGSFAIAASDSERFAAVVPVCGGGQPETMAPRLRSVPLWVFHGAADDVVPVDRSREMVAAIRAAGGDVRYTEYPGVGHASWDVAYREQALSDWLFAQRKD